MLQELKAKSILHFHERTFSTNWDANIYRGCEHNCKYCFAQYSHRYLETNEFFSDIFVKSNAHEILNKELRKRKWRKHPVNVCGISDCYQPVEAQYKIMPKVIQSFIDAKNPLVIVTKSILALRDIELIKELNRVTQVSVLISVSSLDEKKRKLIEPKAAPTLKRFEMLRKFREIGCQTAVLFMPIIPYISDDLENLEEIFRITSEWELGAINAWPLHLHGRTKGEFYSFLDYQFPQLLDKFKKLYKGGSVSDEYRLALQSKISKLRKKYKLYDQYKPTPPREIWTQPSLFD